MKEKELPDINQDIKPIPDSTVKEKRLPERKSKIKPVPEAGNIKNIVYIGGTPVEIKPTKLKYHRNNTASFYKLVEFVPLTEIMMMNEEAFGDGRDGDKALMDWLIAATDNEQLIVDNYDNMDADIIEKILEIFKRVNHITEKEERQKNAMGQGGKG